MLEEREDDEDEMRNSLEGLTGCTQRIETERLCGDWMFRVGKRRPERSLLQLLRAQCEEVIQVVEGPPNSCSVHEHAKDDAKEGEEEQSPGDCRGNGIARHLESLACAVCNDKPVLKVDRD